MGLAIKAQWVATRRTALYFFTVFSQYIHTQLFPVMDALKDPDAVRKPPRPVDPGRSKWLTGPRPRWTYLPMSG